MMTGFLTKLFLLQTGLLMEWPEHRLRPLALVEMPVEEAGTHRYLLHLKESDRSFRFLLEVDKSVCAGEVTLNGEPVAPGEVEEAFRFDRGNEVRLTGCLERTPAPLRILAVPRVYIARGRVLRQGPRGYELEVEVRNTLPNAVTCALEAGDEEEQFLLGPQTSQTRRVFVRLTKVKGRALLCKLWKFAETFEGNYQHVVEILPPGQP